MTAQPVDGQEAHEPDVELDATGAAWIVWTQRGRAGEEIRLGPLRDLESTVTVSDAPGIHLQPALASLQTPLDLAQRQADEAQLRKAGIKLGVDYPKPILDLKQTRERALARYKKLS